MLDELGALMALTETDFDTLQRMIDTSVATGLAPILETMVTKEHVKDVVRIADMDNVVRREDLDDVVRKADMDNVVRKEDLDDVVRKTDIDNVVRRDDLCNVVTRDDLSDMITTYNLAQMATKDDIHALRNDIAQVITFIHEGHSEIQEYIDRKFASLRIISASD